MKFDIFCKPPAKYNYNTSMDRLSVFIDESGTLPDPHDKIIVIAAVVAKHPERIDNILKRAKRTGKLGKQTGELKFYTAGDKTKIAFFELFAKEKFSVFILADITPLLPQNTKNPYLLKFSLF